MAKSDSTLVNWRLIFLTIIVTLFLPLVFLLYLPTLLFQKLGIVYTKYIYWDRKNILKIMSTESQLPIHDFFKPTPRFNIVNCWIGEGKMSIQSLRELVTTNIVERKIKKRMESRFEYPELKYHPISIGGYHYWKKVPNFDIKNYVKIFDYNDIKNDLVVENTITTNMGTLKTTTVTEKQVKRIIAHLVTAGWKAQQSPWDFWLINNVQDENNLKNKKSVVLFRTHHSIADGYSILNIKKYLSEGNFAVSSTPKANSQPRKNPINIRGKKFLESLFLFLLLPYQIANVIDELLYEEKHCWTLAPKDINVVGEKLLLEWSSAIPIASVKSIKNKFGVSFNAVVNTVVAGAMHNLMKSIGQEVPKNITSLTLVPLPGHPGGLNNRFGLLLIRLLTGEPNSEKRLTLAAKELKKLGKSTLPYMSYIVLRFLTIFPSLVTKQLCSMKLGCSLIFSIFPGLDGSYKWADHTTVGGMFTLGTGAGDIGATITAFSCVETIRFSILIDRKVYPSEKELEAFDGFVQKEIQTLMDAIRAN